jgi:hypothetical protein
MELKDFLNSINHDKKPLLDSGDDEKKSYPPFIVNKIMSYFNDTIFHANEMNCCPWLDSKSQFDFYRIAVRKKKRYSPWMKKVVDKDLTAIKEAFNYSETKAREVLNIIGPEELAKIEASLYKGGPKS